MYYKVISEGQIIDVCDGLNYVKWQARNRLFLSCEANGADGIVASDGSAVYLLTGAEPVGDCAYVTTVEISLEEYDELRAQLIDGGMIEDDTADPGNEPVARAKWLERLEVLEAQNAMLTECLLEMSEVVYG